MVLSEELEESEDEGEDPALDSLSQAIAFQVPKYTFCFCIMAAVILFLRVFGFNTFIGVG